MNRLETIHRAIAALHLGSLVCGLMFTEIGPLNINVVLITVLLLALRAKFWIDDEAYFSDVASKTLEGGSPFIVGIIFASISWLLWLLAAIFVRNIDAVSYYMIASFAASTAWIIAAIVKRGAYQEQVIWLFFNGFYIFGFWLLVSRKASWIPWHPDPEKFCMYVIIAMFAVFIADLSATRILEYQRRGKSF